MCKSNMEMRALVHRVRELCARDEEFHVMYKRAFEVIDRSVDLYGMEGICLSFNGGKDSTVVYHLLRVVLAERALNSETDENAPLDVDGIVLETMKKMPVMYFDTKDQFPEVDEFVQRFATKHGFEYRVYACSYIDGLKDMYENGAAKAIWMGVRAGDPHTIDLEHFHPTSRGWPNFMRINPILKWNYKAVWQFLRECNLEYCCLYDQGYTSLGNVNNTVKNPALLRRASIENSEETYAPAYELSNFSLERAGRSSAKK